MAKVEPAPGYAITRDEAGAMRIVVATPSRPGRAVLFGLLTLGFGGAFAAVCALAVALALDNRQSDPTALGLPVLYFPTTALPGLVFGILCLWQTAGREVIWVGDAELTTRKELLGIGSAKTFDLFQVGEVRVAMDRSGGICFEHHKGIHRFCRGLGLKDRRAVVAAINGHLGRATKDEGPAGKDWFDRDDDDRLQRG